MKTQVIKVWTKDGRLTKTKPSAADIDAVAVKRLCAIYDFSAKVDKELCRIDKRFSADGMLLSFVKNPKTKEKCIGVITYQDTLDYTPTQYAEKVVRDYCKHHKGQHNDIVKTSEIKQ